MVHRIVALGTMAVVLALSVTTHAEVIYGKTGPSPFGLNGQDPIAIGWSQTHTFSNVTITIPLADRTSVGPTGSVQGTVYLTNQVGPGTTEANNVAPPVTFSSLTDTFTPYSVFSGLNLAPGNYFITFATASTTGGNSLSPQGSSSPVTTLGTGVTDLGAGCCGTVDAFPPASAVLVQPFSSPSGNLHMTVEGTLKETPVPTLGPWMLLLLAVGLPALALMRLRDRLQTA